MYLSFTYIHTYIHTHILSNTSARVPLTDPMKQSLFREADGFSDFPLPLSKYFLSPLLHCDLLKNFHMLLRKVMENVLQFLVETVLQFVNLLLS